VQGSGTRRDDADEAGYRQACAWGEALRASWPPAWFPLRPRTIRFDVRVPALTDGRQYSLVLHNGKYWFSGQTTKSAVLAIDVLTDEPFKGVLVRTNDQISRFEIVKRLFGGEAAALRTDQVYKVEP